MRFELPPSWTVRYDYHEHPRGISAIVFDGFGVRSVGFAKYNPRDPQFSDETGKRIALGRALAGRSRFIGASHRPHRPRAADELLASG